jgi:hypothetical protein
MRTQDRAHAVKVAIQAALCRIVLAAGLIFPCISSADDAPAAPPEPACMKQCAALAFDDDYCNRACKVPPAQPFPPNHGINWDCATQCRASGGEMRSCIQACKRN